MVTTDIENDETFVYVSTSENDVPTTYKEAMESDQAHNLKH